MRQIAVLLVLCAMALPVVAGKKEQQTFAPLPKQINEAKTVYIDNQYGDPRAADVAYKTLTEWGRFKVVDYTDSPDLVIRLRPITYDVNTGKPSTTVQNNTTVIVNSRIERQPYDFNAAVKPFELPKNFTVYLIAMDVINPSDSVVLWTVTAQTSASSNPKKSGVYRCLAELAARMPKESR